MSRSKRKWEWIAEKCKKMECFSAANVAEFIDKTFSDVYDNRETYWWIYYSEDVELFWRMTNDKHEFLISVSIFRAFSMGCGRHGNVCCDCEMGKRYGACHKTGSLVHFWKYVLSKDLGKEADEEVVLNQLLMFKVWYDRK